jgi:hypothetical protein
VTLAADGHFGTKDSDAIRERRADALGTRCPSAGLPFGVLAGHFALQYLVPGSTSDALHGEPVTPPVTCLFVFISAARCVGQRLDVTT